MGVPAGRRRATPPLLWRVQGASAILSSRVERAENAPRKARERTGVEQGVEAGEALLESEPRRLTQCSTHARKGGRFGAGVKGVGAIDLDGMDHMAGAKGHHRRSNAAWHGATCDALAAIDLGLE